MSIHKSNPIYFTLFKQILHRNKTFVATLALARDQGKGVARLRAYK
jgi:hypothetical protein